MIVFPNAKINVGLRITSKRPDGFHELESVFYPVNWKDVLEVNESEKLSFVSTGIEIPGKGSNNLCVKAFELIKEAYDIPNVKIHLHKNIPIGAGMGGGSSDGAFMIKALNKLFKLKLSLDKQIELASKLGSDCPFFILNKPCYVEGVGNIMKPFDISLKGFKVILVYPKLHIDTSWAYAQIIPEKSESNWQKELFKPVKDWKAIKNDFEITIFDREPVIENIKKKLYAQGAYYASMSGSGSTVFAIFDREKVVDLSPYNKFQTCIHEE
mgnify:CR=1 FL=1